MIKISQGSRRVSSLLSMVGTKSDAFDLGSRDDLVICVGCRSMSGGTVVADWCDLERYCPHLVEVMIDGIHEADGRIVIEARSGAARAACPHCDTGPCEPTKIDS